MVISGFGLHHPASALLLPLFEEIMHKELVAGIDGSSCDAGVFGF